MDRRLLWLLTATSVFAVGNIYYSQPLLGEIGKSFARSPAAIGFVPTLAQLGYVMGLLFVTPLGDVLEKRRLVVTLLLLSGIALFAAALAPTFIGFVACIFAIGVTAVLVQILIPFVASLSSPEDRGRNLGTILSGALIGVLISRSFSGFVGGHIGWRGMYFVASGLMLGFALVAQTSLPKYEPSSRLPYSTLIHSLWLLFKKLPKLRAIALNGALMYASLSAFWATLVFHLQAEPFSLGPQAAGAFGLAGAVGAVSANLAGRSTNRIGPRRLVQLCMGGMATAFAVMALFGNALLGLVAGVVLLDLSAQAATTSNQTQIYALHPDAPTRLNTIYKIFYFGGGSCGSALAAHVWQKFGWQGVCFLGLAFLSLAMIWERLSGLSRSSH